MITSTTRHVAKTVWLVYCMKLSKSRHVLIHLVFNSKLCELRILSDMSKYYLSCHFCGCWRNVPLNMFAE